MYAMATIERYIEHLLCRVRYPNTECLERHPSLGTTDGAAGTRRSAPARTRQVRAVGTLQLPSHSSGFDAMHSSHPGIQEQSRRYSQPQAGGCSQSIAPTSWPHSCANATSSRHEQRESHSSHATRSSICSPLRAPSPARSRRPWRQCARTNERLRDPRRWTRRVCPRLCPPKS